MKLSREGEWRETFGWAPFVMFVFSLADAVNNPYERSPVQKWTITAQSVFIKHARTHVHTQTHTHAHPKTTPVNTWKHQLLTVTTLFFFVIQSNHTPLPSLPPLSLFMSAWVHLLMYVCSYRSFISAWIKEEIKSSDYCFLNYLIEEDLMNKLEKRLRSFKSKKGGWMEK